MTSRNVPVDVSNLTGGVASVAAGYAHTCAVMDAANGGSLRCWGDNFYGELGIDPGWTPLDVVGFTPPPTYSIEGWVNDSDGKGLGDVSLFASPGFTTSSVATGDYKFTGLPAGTYSVWADKPGYAFCPYKRQVTIPPSEVGQVFNGIEAVASLIFCPSNDGYQFANWGDDPATPATDDLTVDDMRRIFGDDAVCVMQDGRCDPKPQAIQWLQTEGQDLDKGRCDGFTSTSIRFFKDFDKHLGVIRPRGLPRQICSALLDRSELHNYHPTAHLLLSEPGVGSTRLRRPGAMPSRRLLVRCWVY